MKKLFIKIKNIVSSKKRKIIFSLINKGFFSDKRAIKFLYKISYGKRINLLNPVLFSEKINWCKLYCRSPQITRIADKASFKDYVAETLNSNKYSFRTFGVWNKFDEIDFEALPNAFVIKATHDSGSIMVVKDKKCFNKEFAKKWFDEKMARNHYNQFREWSYKNIHPRLIIEEYVEALSSPDSIEYKFFMSYGETKFLTIQSGPIHTSQECCNIFDENFNEIDVSVTHERKSEKIFNKPDCFDEMKTIAKKLSYHFPIVRVDFYIIGKKIYLSEMTFYPHAGFIKFNPKEYDKIFGNKFPLKGVAPIQSK